MANADLDPIYRMRFLVQQLDDITATLVLESKEKEYCRSVEKLIESVKGWLGELNKKIDEAEKFEQPPNDADMKVLKDSTEGLEEAVDTLMAFKKKLLGRKESKPREKLNPSAVRELADVRSRPYVQIAETVKDFSQTLRKEAIVAANYQEVMEDIERFEQSVEEALKIVDSDEFLPADFEGNHSLLERLTSEPDKSQLKVVSDWILDVFKVPEPKP